MHVFEDRSFAGGEPPHNSTNHDIRFMIENYSARSISLAAGNGSLKNGSLNGVVCANVSRHAPYKKDCRQVF
jgi:hypothetical protein